MVLLGLTGVMGAGKSALAQQLGALGAIVIDADQIGHQVIEQPQIRQALIATFGTSIVGENNQLDRRQLGRLAFADAQSLQRLNGLVRPVLEQALWQQIATEKERIGRGLLILDAPLIFEWNIAHRFDLVIVVHTDKAIRLARLSKRGLTAAEIQRRMAGQLTAKEKRSRADIVVLNNGNRASLRLEARALWARLTQMYPAGKIE